ncbi:LON peptidase substrate-binding domain-containing protein [Spongiimicrobium salis]|uniref:LON peptidase substrate-binding domain-containing protein n=1 Tax=Spongiimicrobium salis TaxID=1667022 RepID=UPI00374DBB54
MRIPLFPLESVYFPNERVPLHIFEARYKQLIQDCREEALTFGIPVYINDTLAYGTEMTLVEIMKTYENGEMDVICSAQRIFKVLTFDRQMDEKLYAGGIVQFLENVEDGNLAQKEKVTVMIKELYQLMEVPLKHIDPTTFNSYSLAHKIGLSIEQEHQLLQITYESERLRFLQDHLVTTIAILKEVNRTKKVIAMNGHFRNFDPLDFKDIEL